MVNTITLKELRPNLPQVVGDIDSKFDRYVVTKHGKPTVVMLSVDDYESLLETLNILADKETMRDLKEGIKEAASGQTTSLKAFLKKHEEV